LTGFHLIPKIWQRFSGAACAGVADMQRPGRGSGCRDLVGMA
jgi:hypothetical protein